jgi:hypothetical protein
VRYCGIDVSSRLDRQQLVTLHERRTGGQLELVATFYAAGTVEAVAATVRGFGSGTVCCVDAPSGRRLDLLAAGMPLRAALDLPDHGPFERHRVCDALLHRRGVPLYPVPTGSGADGWARWLSVGFALFTALAPLGLHRPRPEAPGALGGPVTGGALGYGRLAEAYPDATFTTLLGHRPSAKRTPWGLQQRIAALKLRGVIDADGGLWHRTLDELDACACALAAYAMGSGRGSWVGDPREAVVVLPVAELAPRYERLPEPARAALSAP